MPGALLPRNVLHTDRFLRRCRWHAPRATVSVTAAAPLYTAFHRGHAAAYAARSTQLVVTPHFDLSLQDTQPEWLANRVSCDGACVSFVPDEAAPFEGGTAVRVTAVLPSGGALACTLFRCGKSSLRKHVRARYAVRANGTAGTLAVALVLRRAHASSVSTVNATSTCGGSQYGSSEDVPPLVTIVLAPQTGVCAMSQTEQVPSTYLWVRPHDVSVRRYPYHNF
jgi:hypothetical protein